MTMTSAHKSLSCKNRCNASRYTVFACLIWDVRLSLHQDRFGYVFIVFSHRLKGYRLATSSPSVTGRRTTAQGSSISMWLPWTTQCQTWNRIPLPRSRSQKLREISAGEYFNSGLEIIRKGWFFFILYFVWFLCSFLCAWRKMVYDPEDPRCARLTLTGKMVEVSLEELAFAKEAMFSRYRGSNKMLKWEDKHWHRLN